MKNLLYLNTISLSAILGISHGIADAAAGWILGSLLHTMTLEEASLPIVLYNFLAFGYQPIAGILTDKIKKPRLAIILGLLFLAAALLALSDLALTPTLAIILAGIGSAAFHVGGGACAISATPNRTIAPGIFAAPGVIGLAVGSALGITDYGGSGIIILLLLSISIAIALIKFPPLPYPKLGEGEEKEEDDWVMLLLLSAIALRSTVWTSFQFILQARLASIIVMAIAAAGGKVLGGILAERYGWRLWTVTSLSIATILLALGGENLFTLLPGLALLQSSIPITLAATARLMPQKPATAAGLTLGLGIIIGGIPVIGGLSYLIAQPAIAFLILLTTTLSLWWVLKPSSIGKKQKTNDKEQITNVARSR